MKTDFVQLTFVQACTGFNTKVRSELPDFHPITAKVGDKGCEAILYTRNPAGFRIVGEDGQHFWVSPANVVWGRESEERVNEEQAPAPVVPITQKAGPGRPKKL